MNFKVSNILIVSIILHIIAFILFAKWLGKKESSLFKKMNKIKVVGISILILTMPLILNNILQTLNKTWYYAGKTGIEAIEYKKMIVSVEWRKMERISNENASLL